MLMNRASDRKKEKVSVSAINFKVVIDCSQMNRDRNVVMMLCWNFYLHFFCQKIMVINIKLIYSSQPRASLHSRKLKKPLVISFQTTSEIFLPALSSLIY
jgi:hypothetical protein